MTADTGVDALTHALEAGVSIFASPFTDAFCMQAINLILDSLPRAYADGSDLEARTAMANAATIAGLAFSNAFVGVNHALAHAVGARFGIAHGRANGDLPAARPALQRVAADQVHAGARLRRLRRAREVRPDRLDPRHRRQRRPTGASACLSASSSCCRGRGEPASLAQPGIARAEFEASLPDLAKAAFSDPSLRTNPRIPLISEIIELLQLGFAG